jgi:putative endonuclease
MTEGECLVIVEVRYRRGKSHGGALSSVTRTKQRRILQATRHLLQRHPALQRRPLRFDVVALTGAAGAVTVQWLRNAFDAS